MTVKKEINNIFSCIILFDIFNFSAPKNFLIEHT